MFGIEFGKVLEVLQCKIAFLGSVNFVGLAPRDLISLRIFQARTGWFSTDFPRP